MRLMVNLSPKVLRDLYAPHPSSPKVEGLYAPHPSLLRWETSLYASLLP